MVFLLLHLNIRPENSSGHQTKPKPTLSLKILKGNDTGFDKNHSFLTQKTRFSHFLAFLLWVCFVSGQRRSRVCTSSCVRVCLGFCEEGLEYRFVCVDTKRFSRVLHLFEGSRCALIDPRFVIDYKFDSFFLFHRENLDYLRNFSLYVWRIVISVPFCFSLMLKHWLFEFSLSWLLWLISLLFFN